MGTAEPNLLRMGCCTLGLAAKRLFPGSHPHACAEPGSLAPLPDAPRRLLRYHRRREQRPLADWQLHWRGQRHHLPRHLQHRLHGLAHGHLQQRRLVGRERHLHAQ